MSESGYNPLRWICDERGCFNLKKRPKIEVFADCFPGRISFGDVDGVVEMQGRFLYLEWKPSTAPLPVGQRILMERRTSDGVSTYIVVVGDPEAMAVTHYRLAYGGTLRPWVAATLGDVKQRLIVWAAWARSA